MIGDTVNNSNSQDLAKKGRAADNTRYAAGVLAIMLTAAGCSDKVDTYKTVTPKGNYSIALSEDGSQLRLKRSEGVRGFGGHTETFDFDVIDPNTANVRHTLAQIQPDFLRLKRYHNTRGFWHGDVEYKREARHAADSTVLNVKQDVGRNTFLRYKAAALQQLRQTNR